MWPAGVPVPVPLEEESDFSFDIQAFDRLINDRTRLIILNSPANPTGGDHVSCRSEAHCGGGDPA